MSDDVLRDAHAVGELFPAMYLRFAEKRRPSLTSQQWSVLQHLAMSGPLTIGEAAKHFGRAQSVVSEIVDGLEAKGLLERMRDARDHRRTLVWLTEQGLAKLDEERRVLDEGRLATALRAMRPADRAALLRGMRALIAATDSLRTNGMEKGKGKGTKR